MNIKYLKFYVSIVLYNLLFMLLGIVLGNSLLAAASVKDELFPVILDGKQLPALMEKPISHIRAYAVHNGKTRAIPFQIDRRDQENNWVWEVINHDQQQNLQSGNPAPMEQSLFDHNDQLLFMAFDLGERSAQSLTGVNAEQVVELGVSYGSAPIRTGWIYLTYEASPAPRSDLGYMSYDDDAQQVASPVYQLRYAENSIAIIDTMAINGNPIINQTRLEGSAEVNLLLFNKKIHFDATRIKGHSLGYINGPIRTIRGFVTSIDIAAGITSSQMPITHLFYPHHTEVPLPMTRDFLVKNMVLDIAARYPETDACKQTTPVLHASNDASGNANHMGNQQLPTRLSLDCPTYSMLTLVKIPSELSDKVELSAYIIDQEDASMKTVPPEVNKMAGFHLATGNHFPAGQFYLNVISVFSNQPALSHKHENIARIINNSLSLTTPNRNIAIQIEQQSSDFSHLSFLSETEK